MPILQNNKSFQKFSVNTVAVINLSQGPNMKKILFSLLVLQLFVACSDRLETEITIHAPRQKVWEIFADTASYPGWNPMILEFGGEMKQGEQIRVKLKQPGDDAMEFTPLVTEMIAGQVFEWQGKLLFDFLFSGRHRFEFVEISANKTLLKQSEQFSGILLPALNMENTRKGFELMNDALKKRAEK